MFSTIENLQNYVTDLVEEYKSKMLNFPDNFNWAEIDENDTEYFKQRKKNISKPKNQYSLGVCWAAATVTAVSDAYVIKLNLPFNPNLSITYAVSAFNKAGSCSGGFPAILLHSSVYLNSGFASESCIDYSWCSGTPECTSEQGIEHFTSKKNMASNLPTPGCYNDKVKHYMYRVHNFAHIDYSCLERFSSEDIEKIVKLQILCRSTVPVSIPIMKNFSNPFWKNEIFKKIYFEGDCTEILGFHVVTVVGWGIEDLYLDKHYRVKFWICRNSWGKKWGENGYFRMASYPFNKLCQLENPVTRNFKGAVYIPSISLFDVWEYPQVFNYNKTRLKNNFLLMHDLYYYNTDEDILINKGIFESFEEEEEFTNKCKDFFTRYDSFQVNKKSKEMVLCRPALDFFPDNYISNEENMDWEAEDDEMDWDLPDDDKQMDIKYQYNLIEKFDPKI